MPRGEIKEYGGAPVLEHLSSFVDPIAIEEAMAEVGWNQKRMLKILMRHAESDSWKASTAAIKILLDHTKSGLAMSGLVRPVTSEASKDLGGGLRIKATQTSFEPGCSITALEKLDSIIGENDGEETSQEKDYIDVEYTAGDSIASGGGGCSDGATCRDNVDGGGTGGDRDGDGVSECPGSTDGASPITTDESSECGDVGGVLEGGLEGDGRDGRGDANLCESVNGRERGAGDPNESGVPESRSGREGGPSQSQDGDGVGPDSGGAEEDSDDDRTPVNFGRRPPAIRTGGGGLCGPNG